MSERDRHTHTPTHTHTEKRNREGQRERGWGGGGGSQKEREWGERQTDREPTVSETEREGEKGCWSRKVTDRQRGSGERQTADS